MKTERTRIHFFRDVFAAVAVAVLGSLRSLLFAMELEAWITCEWQKNSLASCPTNMSPKHYTKRYKHKKNELWKTVRVTEKFSKTTIAIRFNLLQACPFMPSFVFAAVLNIPSCNVLNGYFYVSLSLLVVAFRIFLRISNLAISWQRRNISLEKRAFKLLWSLFLLQNEILRRFFGEKHWRDNSYHQDRLLKMLATIGDIIVETLYSNRVTSEDKRISTPLPCPLHSKLGSLLFSIGSSNGSTTLHGGSGGWKAIFSPSEVRKTSKSPLRAKCRS